mmetsp:Transcript_82294/g.113841  ORF Transcript_82294/g.113841 Transcript_82294/m.113841 type:complete len:225 (+) Transcript_82294:85-759(+)
MRFASLVILFVVKHVKLFQDLFDLAGSSIHLLVDIINHAHHLINLCFRIYGLLFNTLDQSSSLFLMGSHSSPHITNLTLERSLHLNDLSLPGGIVKSFRLDFFNYIEENVIAFVVNFILWLHDLPLSNENKLIDEHSFGLIDDNLLFALAVFEGVTHLCNEHIHKYDQVCKGSKDENGPAKIGVRSVICHSKLTKTYQVRVYKCIKRLIITDLNNEIIINIRHV